MLKNVRKFLIFTHIILNVDNSINTLHSKMKFSVIILDNIMEETMSQIYHIGPSSHFMIFRI